VIDSNLGRRQLRFVLAWAELHQEEVDVLDRMRGGADLAPDTLYERIKSGAWPESRAAA
jgi:hypothetical protein